MSTTASNNSNNNEKKTRRACGPCINSKVKCDQGRPCTRCARRGVTCFDMPSKPRVMHKKPSGDALPIPQQSPSHTPPSPGFTSPQIPPNMDFGTLEHMLLAAAGGGDMQMLNQSQNQLSSNMITTLNPLSTLSNQIPPLPSQMSSQITLSPPQVSVSASPLPSPIQSNFLAPPLPTYQSSSNMDISSNSLPTKRMRGDSPTTVKQQDNTEESNNHVSTYPHSPTYGNTNNQHSPSYSGNYSSSSSSSSYSSPSYSPGQPNTPPSSQTVPATPVNNNNSNPSPFHTCISGQCSCSVSQDGDRSFINAAPTPTSGTKHPFTLPEYPRNGPQTSAFERPNYVVYMPTLTVVDVNVPMTDLLCCPEGPQYIRGRKFSDFAHFVVTKFFIRDLIRILRETSVKTFKRVFAMKQFTGAFVFGEMEITLMNSYILGTVQHMYSEIPACYQYSFNTYLGLCGHMKVQDAICDRPYCGCKFAHIPLDEKDLELVQF